MFTKQFWKAAGERAVKTFAQTLGALLAVTAATSIVDFDWGFVLGASATATVLSLLTSIASAPVGQEPTPSLVGEGA